MRDGQVVDAGSDDARVQGVRRMTDMMDAEPPVTATAIQATDGPERFAELGARFLGESFAASDVERIDL